MSRFIESDNENKNNIVTLDDPKKCAWMYNEVCCNSNSCMVADYPGIDYCIRCKFFTKETMKPGEKHIASLF